MSYYGLSADGPGRSVARPSRVLRAGLLAIVMSVGIMLVSGAASASALNLTGTWTAVYHCEVLCAGSEFPATDVLTQAEGSNVVTGSNGGESISGTLNGNTFSYRSETGSYTSEATLTISADGNSWSGPLHDSNGTSGTYTATRASSSTNNEEEAKKAKSAEEAKKKEEEEKNGKRPTGTSVVCNYEFATAENTCVASVGDGGPQPPTVTPTGTVTFTTTSGGFTNGATCTLVATPDSPQVASCSLVYETAFSGLPSITATYNGDARHAGSAGHTQLFGTAPEEISVETPNGKPGEYPNELKLETEVPANGTTVEASAQPSELDPVPVPIDLPKIDSSLDAEVAADLRSVEALVNEIDVTGAQNQKTVAETEQTLGKLNERAVELVKSSSPSDQAQGQKAIDDSDQVIEELAKVEKLRAEVLKSVIQGGGVVAQEDGEIEKLDKEALKSLGSSSAAEQAKGQKELEEATQKLDALSKALKEREEVSKQIIQNMKGYVARRNLKKVKIVRAKSIGYTVKPNVAAGKLKLSLRLNDRSLNKLAGKHNSLAVLVRITMLVPGKNFKGGVPRTFLERLTLKRAPGSHKKHSKH